MADVSHPEGCGDRDCLICYPVFTKTGRRITQDDLDQWVAEAEAGYDLPLAELCCG